MKMLPLRARTGVTLIELLIVLVILGILGGIAAPNYSVTVARISVAAETKRMIGILKQARNEARARGATVTVRRDSGTDWGGQILVYESTDIAGNTDYAAPAASATVGDDLVSRHSASRGSVSVRDNASGNGEFISFSLQGWLSTSETSEILIAVCSPVLPAADGMYIEVNRVGKIRERTIGTDPGGCL